MTVLRHAASLLLFMACTVRAETPLCPIAYWPLTENGKESLTGEYSGEIVGDGVFEDSALQLNGENACVVFGNDAGLEIAGDFSFCLWVKPATDSRLMRLVGKLQVAGDQRDFCSFLSVSNRLWAFLSDNGTAEESHSILQATADPALTPGEWHQVAVTWNSAVGTTGLCIYVDGKKKAALPAQSAGITNLHVGTAPLTLGAYDLQQGQPLQNPFAGSLCNMTLFEGVLTSADVQSLYEAGRMADPIRRLEELHPVGARAVRTGAAIPDHPEGQTTGRGHSEYPAGKVIYVDCTNGDDRLSGHARSSDGVHGPKKTIWGGLRIAGRGDVIHVSSGEYHEGPVAVPSGTRMEFQGKVTIY